MSAETNHIIDLKRLSDGVYPFDFHLDSTYFAGIEKSEITGGEVQVHAVLTLRGSGVAGHTPAYGDGLRVQMTVQGTVQTVCDRCLDLMNLPVDASDEDMETNTADGTLDLAWLAYELASVSLPLVHRHQEGECNPAMEAVLRQHEAKTADAENQQNEE